MIRSIVASAKVIISFFLHLHIVKIREIRNVKNITTRRKMSFLLKICLNIYIVVEISYRRRCCKNEIVFVD